MNRRSTLQTYLALGLLGAGLLTASLIFKNQISDLIDNIQGQPPGKEGTIRVVPPNQEQSKPPKNDSKTSHTGKPPKTGQQTTSNGSSTTTQPLVPGLPELPISGPSATDGGSSGPTAGGTGNVDIGNPGGSGPDPGGGPGPGPGPGPGGGQGDPGVLGPICNITPQACNLSDLPNLPDVPVPDLPDIPKVPNLPDLPDNLPIPDIKEVVDSHVSDPLGLP